MSTNPQSHAPRSSEKPCQKSGGCDIANYVLKSMVLEWACMGVMVRCPSTFLFGSPAWAATSVNVPSPLLRNRKLGLYSLSQNISGRVWLSIGPTTTPRPPIVQRRDSRIYHMQCANHYSFSSPFLYAGMPLFLLTQTTSHYRLSTAILPLTAVLTLVPRRQRSNYECLRLTSCEHFLRSAFT